MKNLKLITYVLILLFFCPNIQAQDINAIKSLNCKSNQRVIQVPCGYKSEDLCLACSECGDGVLDQKMGEECDAGKDNSPVGYCRDCKFPVCGDGQHNEYDEIINSDWTCDFTNDPSCRKDCTKCGDDLINHIDEQCDGIDTADGKTCRSDCLYMVCGDDIIDQEVGETCEKSDPKCRSNCTKCGDGILQDAFEECDDGNSIADDTCSNDCKLTQ